MTLEEIKIRQMTNQYLVSPADKLTVVRDLCGVQAQFMANVLHSLKIRCHDYDEKTVPEGLVKNWTLRGTVHVFAEDDLSLFIRCHNGEQYRKNEWNGRSFWNQRDVWALTPERQRYLTDVILDALANRERTREELKSICRERGMTEPEEGSMFDPWGGGMREICERGFVNYAAEEKKVFRLAPLFEPMREEEAKLELARRYFTNIAPATVHDAMYFLGAKKTEVKKWLSQLPVCSAECEGKNYYFIESDKVYEKKIPVCLFLAGFDSLMLGYQKKESLYLPSEHLRDIFNLAGIVVPSVLLRGQVVGKWRRKNNKLSITLFESVTGEDKKILTDTAESLWADIHKIIFE